VTLAAAPTSTIAHPHGCPVFPDVYGKVVAGASVDPHSDDYIASVQQAGDKGAFHASIGNEQANVADDSTPLLTVVPKVKYHQFLVPYRGNRNSGSSLYPMRTRLWCKHRAATCTRRTKPRIAPAFFPHTPVVTGICRRGRSCRPVTHQRWRQGCRSSSGMAWAEDLDAGCICQALDLDVTAGTLAQYGFVYPGFGSLSKA